MHLNNSPPNVGPVPTAAPLPPVDRNAWSRAVAADRRLTSRDRLIALCLFIAETDQTYDEIGKSAGCGRRTAMRAVATLIERGWLIVKISSTGRVPNTFGMAMRSVAS